ncbi:MAG: hypothetical protein E5W04_33475 [Mesorhizobium sp.]|nr:MAG: hypothetical protein E5W04_33475 [Mesorhizobium sp.]
MAELLRRSRRWLREGKADADEQKRVRKLAETIQRVQRVGSWAFANQTITQEEIAEHLKRIRNDYCKGNLRDSINRFIPQPAGPRCAHIRVPEPLALHAYDGSVEEALAVLRSRMQEAVSRIVTELEAAGGFISYPNPFYHR